MLKILTEMLGILVPIGTLLMLVSLGAFSVLVETFYRKREEKWIFEEEYFIEDANRTTQSISKIPSFRTTLPQKDVMLEMQVKDNLFNHERIVNYNELANYSHSEITDEVMNNLNTIADNINRELNYYGINYEKLKLSNEKQIE